MLRTQGIMDNSAALDIPRADIEIEMLSRYNANSGKMIKSERKDEEEGSPMKMHEVKVKTENPVLEEDLELSLDNVDMGELFAEAQNMLGDTTMSDLVSGDLVNQSALSSDIADQSQLSIGSCDVSTAETDHSDGVVDNFNKVIIKTTLDEGVTASNIQI